MPNTPFALKAKILTEHDYAPLIPPMRTHMSTSDLPYLLRRMLIYPALEHLVLDQRFRTRAEAALGLNPGSTPNGRSKLACTVHAVHKGALRILIINHHLFLVSQ